jgi:hypothetical protein
VRRLGKVVGAGRILRIALAKTEAHLSTALEEHVAQLLLVAHEVVHLQQLVRALKTETESVRMSTCEIRQ